MLQNSDFPKPIGSFRQPVPIPTSGPNDGEQWCVTFNKAWLPHILGALTQLLLQATWDSAVESEVEGAQAMADELLDTFMVGANCGGGTMLIRACTTGCGIEYSNDDGEHWTCVDLGACIENIWDEKLAQAFDDGVLGGPGTYPPNPDWQTDQCYDYDFTLRANDRWPFPIPINDDTTIHVTNLSGGWTDGTAHWFCPDGNRYYLGRCNEGTADTDPGDPLTPAAMHMQVVGCYGTTFFDPVTSLYAVPTGTSEQQAFLQANDGTLSDNGGEIHGHIQICTSSCISHNYRLDQMTATPNGCPPGECQAEWVEGEGFESKIFASGGVQYSAAIINVIPPSGTWQSIRVNYSVITLGASNIGAITYGGTNVPFSWTTTGDHTAILTGTLVSGIVMIQVDPSYGADTGSAIIRGVEFCT